MQGRIARSLDRGRRAAGLCLLAALLWAGTAQATSVIVNPGFEQGPAPGGYLYVPSSVQVLAGWEVVGDSIDYVGSYWAAAEGSRSVGLNGWDAGGLTQVIETVVGHTYQLSFAYAADPNGAAIQSLRVGALDVFTLQSLASEDFAADASGHSLHDMGWELGGIEFVATSASTRLVFESLAAGFHGPALDEVSIVMMPEPAPALLLAAGLAGLGHAGRRRRV